MAFPHARDIDCYTVTTINELWAAAPSVRIGEIAAGDPDIFVLVSESKTPLLRIDVHYPAADYHFAADAIVWTEWIAVGFGARVVLVSLDGAATCAIALSGREPAYFADYFRGFHACPEFLLVGSGTTVSRIDPDGTVRWKSQPLGVDGVLIGDADEAVIRGSGEWDPPGGWRPFSISAETGMLLSGGDPFH